MEISYTLKALREPLIGTIKAGFVDLDHTFTIDMEGREYVIRKYEKETGKREPLEAMGNLMEDLKNYTGSYAGLKEKRYDTLVKLNSIMDTIPTDFLEQPGLYKGLELREGIKEFIDLCNSFSNIKKQVHGPFLDLCLCSHNEFISKASVEAYVESAKMCKEINAKILTIHPGLANSLVKSFHRYNKKRLVEAINDLLDLVKNMDVMICLENMPKKVNLFLKTDEIKEFFANLNRDDIFMTWDTSHSWTCDVDIEIFWKNFNKIIKNVHLVDNYDKEKDNHPALGSGKVNFNEIFKILNEYNYNEALIVELSSAKDLPQSIEFIQKFL